MHDRQIGGYESSSPATVPCSQAGWSPYGNPPVANVEVEPRGDGALVRLHLRAPVNCERDDPLMPQVLPLVEAAWQVRADAYPAMLSRLEALEGEAADLERRQRQAELHRDQKLDCGLPADLALEEMVTIRH